MNESWTVIPLKFDAFFHRLCMWIRSSTTKGPKSDLEFSRMKMMGPDPASRFFIVLYNSKFAQTDVGHACYWPFDPWKKRACVFKIILSSLEISKDQPPLLVFSARSLGNAISTPRHGHSCPIAPLRLEQCELASFQLDSLWTAAGQAHVRGRCGNTSDWSIALKSLGCPWQDSQ